MTEAALEVPTVVVLMSQAMQRVGRVAKAQRNQQQNYNFRGVDAVVNAAAPAFRALGIVPVPHQVDAGYRDVHSRKGEPMREVTLQVEYRFYGPAGDWLTARVVSESVDSSDKATAKAMSVAYRIALLQVLCIPTDDPDPDSTAMQRGRYQRPDEQPETEAEALDVVQDILLTAEAVQQAANMSDDEMKAKIKYYIVTKLGIPGGWSAADEPAWENVRPAQRQMLRNALKKQLAELVGQAEL